MFGGSTRLSLRCRRCGYQKSQGLLTNGRAGARGSDAYHLSFLRFLPIYTCKNCQDQPKWLNGLTTRRLFIHAPSGEGFVKITTEVCSTARNVWSSQGLKSAQIAICGVFPTALTRTRVTGQQAV